MEFLIFKARGGYFCGFFVINLCCFRGLVRPELDQSYGLQRANVKAKVLDTRNEVSTLRSILAGFCFSLIFITRYVPNHITV
jgi:hypothetical protein